MPSSYFHRISSEMPTRMWINNPTPAEAAEAISYGAISCTTNPTYTSRMLKADSEKGTMLAHAKKAAAATQDDHKAAEILQREAAKKLLEIFLPVYEQEPGMQGFVSIQGNPFKDDADHIIQEAMACRELSPNFIYKIPTTKAGLIAMEEVLCAGIPVIATEVMSVSQARAVLQLWERVQRSIKNCPILFVTHITGIYDECLQKNVQKEGIEIVDDVLSQAGWIVARRIYEFIARQDNSKLVLLGGGARQDRHFTDMVGADMHVTINPDMAKRLMIKNPALEQRFFDPVDLSVFNELSDKLPIFHKAYTEAGLEVEEFKDFAPVKYFSDMFLAGWEQTVSVIQNIRKIGFAGNGAHKL